MKRETSVQGRRKTSEPSLSKDVTGPAPADMIDSIAGDPRFMTSLARGLAVMRAFADDARPLAIADISRATGLPRASVRRCLYTLECLGYVEQSGRSFTLRPKMLTLGYAFLASTTLPETAQPFLERLAARLQETCLLGIFDSDEVLYIGRSSTRRIISVALSVGSRVPAYCSSMGRVLLAALPAEEFEAFLTRVKPEALTDRTLVSVSKLSREVAQVRASGYSIVDQELEIGLRALAVPVLDTSGAVVAAMNISTHAARTTVQELRARFLPELRAAASDLGPLIVSRHAKKPTRK